MREGGRKRRWAGLGNRGKGKGKERKKTDVGESKFQPSVQHTIYQALWFALLATSIRMLLIIRRPTREDPKEKQVIEKACSVHTHTRAHNACCAVYKAMA